MKQIPTWFAIAEIALTAWVILAIASILCYEPFWLPAGLSKKRRRPAARGIRAWPLVAVSSLAVAFVVSGGDIFPRTGNLTVWSVAFLLCTLVYAFASVAGAVTVRRAQHAVRAYVRTYSPAVILALLFSTA